MIFALLIIVLAVGWAAITSSFAIGNLVLGAAIAAAALFPVRRQIAHTTMFRKTGRIVSLAGLFVVELMLSAIRVAALVVRPDLNQRIRPAFIAFPLTATKDAEITLLANLITLTPGTLSVDVSDDRRVLYVHAIDAADREAVVRDIAKGFERKVIEVFE